MTRPISGVARREACRSGFGRGSFEDRIEACCGNEVASGVVLGIGVDA